MAINRDPAPRRPPVASHELAEPSWWCWHPRCGRLSAAVVARQTPDPSVAPPEHDVIAACSRHLSWAHRAQGVGQEFGTAVVRGPRR